MPRKRDPAKNLLLAENAVLKSKLALALGNLENAALLLKNKNPEFLEKNYDLVKTSLEKLLADLKK